MTSSEIVEAIERVSPGPHGFVVVRVHSGASPQKIRELAQIIQEAITRIKGPTNVIILRHGHTIHELAKPERWKMYEALSQEFRRDLTCIGCGCTEGNACPGGCGWIYEAPNGRDGVCSTCYTRDNA